ncbi:hypothetical protein [Moorena sp. SIO4G3]|uniref:hypothetical protein n=1 Tax=Moorena sp. SIO4G3 TaxID=2607821 RepID=UPI00142AE3E6|nr:hypothetical protein [Moorena sp. SIO4G3]NEO80486.1 hypothetical protein [Moorena sp. SIO4G3]
MPSRSVTCTGFARRCANGQSHFGESVGWALAGQIPNHFQRSLVTNAHQPRLLILFEPSQPNWGGWISLKLFNRVVRYGADAVGETFLNRLKALIFRLMIEKHFIVLYPNQHSFVT